MPNPAVGLESLIDSADKGTPVKVRRLIFAVVVAMALPGCESAPIKEMRQGIGGLFQRNTGEQDLAGGVKQYEAGNYSEASRLLSASLEQGLSSSGQVTARKYLAFIHCISGRESRCREEFRATLRIDPSFDLAANEAGHPVWGPVFRSVKARR
jgi:Tfp pilus assembly protein PilF